LKKKEGLKDEMELQSYFVRRIEEYLNAKGKSVIGWDEILEGGIAPNATIMSWRGIDGGIAAAKAGHDAIMTPGKYCYFDKYQGDRATEPIAIGGFLPWIVSTRIIRSLPLLTPEEAKHILGAQGNVWTEYIGTTDYVEYMAYPRAMALAEVLWTPGERKSWASFQERLKKQVDRLGGMKVNFATQSLR
jgi:hexosaminidase